MLKAKGECQYERTLLGFRFAGITSKDVLPSNNLGNRMRPKDISNKMKKFYKILTNAFVMN